MNKIIIKIYRRTIKPLGLTWCGKQVSKNFAANIVIECIW